MKTLESTLSEIATIEKQIADTTTLQTRLEGELNAAMESGDVEDNKVIKAVQDIKTKLDLCPRRLDQLNQKLAKLETTSEELAQSEGIRVSRRANGLHEKLVASVAKLIAPVCDADEGRAREIAASTPAARLVYGYTSLPGQYALDAKGKLESVLTLETAVDGFATKYANLL